ncbi:sigma-70 family RNA polymerase sigma factor [Parendozoicomonas haliclonae]|uniref:RNA polymerase sigma factor n=1 Tax=Parendozoicomonas haliclonae TaxID=1960125 RepID=A0A1X7AGK6_9GAMM|nr:sigma-70 family RNA polymerase sigma factor [Parendozoicomonas haliclonae]SMA40273.1 ECF RNA polymerase sigma factor RpoE [Parendozoicomonas haliclonae]
MDTFGSASEPRGKSPNSSAPNNSAPDSINQKLVDLGRYRDKRLFLAIYDHFAPRLKSYLVGRGAHSEIAEELVQEAMLSVWRHSSTYNPDKATASTWIFRIARNLWIDRMRRDKAHLLTSLDSCPTDLYPDLSFQPSLAPLDGDTLKSAINNLPQQQAQLVYKVYYQGKTHREIADECDIPLGSVKSGLRLAFGKLKNALGGEL